MDISLHPEFNFLLSLVMQQVDKAQGRTIPSLAVDAYNFWKPAQLGVAIGRATNKKVLQVQNFNMFAAELKHPTIVSDFNQKRGKTIVGDKSCTTKYTTPDIGIHQFNYAVFTQPGATNNCVNEGNASHQESDMDAMNVCPFNTEDLVKEQLFPEFTKVQKECNSMLIHASKTVQFGQFIIETYNMFKF